jgi:hypothetical protein
LDWDGGSGEELWAEASEKAMATARVTATEKVRAKATATATGGARATATVAGEADRSRM